MMAWLSSCCRRSLVCSILNGTAEVAITSFLPENDQAFTFMAPRDVSPCCQIRTLALTLNPASILSLEASRDRQVYVACPC